MTTRMRPSQNIAISFFNAFSRFEYALKRTGHLRNREIAEADWDTFADSLGRPFLHEVRTRAVAPTLLAEPPKKLMKDDQRVGWREAPRIEDVRGLFNAVRQTGNNLFHGEKFTGDGRSDSRDRQLLTDALRILELALAKSDQIKKAFAEDDARNAQLSTRRR